MKNAGPLAKIKNKINILTVYPGPLLLLARDRQYLNKLEEKGKTKDNISISIYISNLHITLPGVMGRGLRRNIDGD